MITICQYERQYHNDVVQMILQIQREEYHLPITAKDQPDLDQIETFYQSADGNFWVAADEGAVVGTVGVKSIGNGNAILRKMFVKREYRGKELGVSYGLLTCSLKWLKRKRFTDLYLGTTPQFTRAHRFYEKNGFEEIGREELPLGFPIMQVDKKFYRCSLVS